jgi:hypothetical protein
MQKRAIRSTRAIRWPKLAIITVLMALAAFFGFLASLSGSTGWLVPQVISWIAALVILILCGSKS